jgi:hypothetical protein
VALAQVPAPSRFCKLKMYFAPSLGLRDWGNIFFFFFELRTYTLNHSVSPFLCV